MYGMAATRKPSGGVFRREQPQGFSVHAILNRSSDGDQGLAELQLSPFDRPSQEDEELT